MKRLFEILFVSVILLFLSPVFIVISALIVLTSPGNPFFSQTRVGKNGKQFSIYKFRKMAASESTNGVGVTLLDDQRMTTMGRILERFKLDELPQFFNVLQGDMSIIGPRPEIPKFVQYYQDKWKVVHSVKPGIFGYAQTICSHEGQLYPENCKDPEAFYVHNILPEKLDAEIMYVNNKSVKTDCFLFVSVAFKFLFESLRITLVLFKFGSSAASQPSQVIQTKYKPSES